MEKERKRKRETDMGMKRVFVCALVLVLVFIFVFVAKVGYAISPTIAHFPKTHMQNGQMNQQRRKINKITSSGLMTMEKGGPTAILFECFG